VDKKFYSKTSIKKQREAKNRQNVAFSYKPFYCSNSSQKRQFVRQIFRQKFFKHPIIGPCLVQSAPDVLHPGDPLLEHLVGRAQQVQLALQRLGLQPPLQPAPLAGLVVALTHFLATVKKFVPCSKKII
jgi:hypothetical protein